MKTLREPNSEMEYFNKAKNNLMQILYVIQSRYEQFRPQKRKLSLVLVEFTVSDMVHLIDQ